MKEAKSKKKGKVYIEAAIKINEDSVTNYKVLITLFIPKNYLTHALDSKYLDNQRLVGLPLNKNWGNCADSCPHHRKRSFMEYNNCLAKLGEIVKEHIENIEKTLKEVVKKNKKKAVPTETNTLYKLEIG